MKIDTDDKLEFVVELDGDVYKWKVTLLVNGKRFDYTWCDLFIGLTKRSLLKKYKKSLHKSKENCRDRRICEKHSGLVVIKKPKVKISKKLKKLREQIRVYHYLKE